MVSSPKANLTVRHLPISIPFTIVRDNGKGPSENPVWGVLDGLLPLVISRMGCIVGEGEAFGPIEAGQYEGGSFASAGLRGGQKVVFVSGRDCLWL